MSSATRRHVAVVGGGWAGLAAAVRAVQLGMRVTLFEMAPDLGGRARSARIGDLMLDNGQHLLIGAYRDTLALMETVGVDLSTAFQRMPLTLVNSDGVGLKLPVGHPSVAFFRGVMGAHHWPLLHRIRLLLLAARWRLRGFRCDATATVADLTKTLPDTVYRDLIAPLCVAALNTPAAQASGSVFLRVLRDALFGGRGASDALLPLKPLAELLPLPAAAWLRAAGARVCLRARVQTVVADGQSWLVDGESFDSVILACSSSEATRLTATSHPDWSQKASRIAFQSIITLYAQHPQAQLAFAMIAVPDGVEQPAQFVFDHGMLTGRQGLLAFVVSGANQWLAKGMPTTIEATLAQARQALPVAPWVGQLKVVGAVAERRATFACTPNLIRPTQRIDNQFLACGDYVEGPYPATLEGAVRSGQAAAAALQPRG